MREWWTVKQFAEHYGIGQRTVYDLIDKGKLAVYRIPGIRIRNDDRLDWERSCRVEPKEPEPLIEVRRPRKLEPIVFKHLKL